MRRSGKWRTEYGSHNGYLDAVVIHGLRSLDQFASQLETLVRRAVGEDIDISYFSFDSTRSLGTDASYYGTYFDKLIKKITSMNGEVLAPRLKLQKTHKVSQQPVSSTGVDPADSSIDHHSGKPERRFLFIAHELASWMLKEVFVHRAGKDILRKTAGIIFLSDKHINREDFDFKAYLQGISPPDTTKAPPMQRAMSFRSRAAEEPLSHRQLRWISDHFKSDCRYDLQEETTWVMESPIHVLQSGNRRSGSPLRWIPDSIRQRLERPSKNHRGDLPEPSKALIAMISRVKFLQGISPIDDYGSFNLDDYRYFENSKAPHTNPPKDIHSPILAPNPDAVTTPLQAIGGRNEDEQVRQDDLEQIQIKEILDVKEEKPQSKAAESKGESDRLPETQLVEGQDLSSSQPPLNPTSPRASFPLPTVDPKPRIQSQDSEINIVASQGLSEKIPTSPSKKHKMETSGDDRTRLVLEHDLVESADMAQRYRSRGDLDNAEVMYQTCITTALKLYPEPDTRDIFIGFRLQSVMVRLAKGHYREVKVELEDLLNDSKLMKPGQRRLSLQQELEYHLCVVRVRLGDYESAKKLLLVLAGQFESTLNTLLENKESSSILGDSKYQTAIGSERLLALVLAFLGDYDQASHHLRRSERACRGIIDGRTSLDEESSPERLQSVSFPPTLKSTLIPLHPFTKNAIKGIQAAVTLTKAKIKLLRGEVQSALVCAESALRNSERFLGRRNVITLESACLNSTLLVFNSRFSDAESLCIATMDEISESLGTDHPLMLEAVYSLAYNFKAQSRPVEALETASSLAARAVEILTEQHPQTLKYKSLLATINLWVGNYTESVRMFHPLLKGFGATMDDWSPSQLRIASEYAVAGCHLGKVVPARHLATEVLKRQLGFFNVELPTQSEALLEGTITVLEQSKAPVSGSNGRFDSHPDLLFTLETLAKIESQQRNANLELVCRVLLLIYNKRKEKGVLGPTHILTLLTGLELGLAYQDCGYLDKSQQYFEEVLRPAEETLRENHPIILGARQGQLMAKVLSGKEYHRKSDWNYSSEWDAISEIQQWQLGRLHPKSIRWLVAKFSIQLILDNKNSTVTAREILGRLRDESVLKARLVESLQIQERLALMYYMRRKYEDSLDILHWARQQICASLEKRGLERQELAEELKTILSGIDREVTMASKDAEKLFKDRLDDGQTAYQNGLYLRAEQCQRRAVTLAEAILRSTAQSNQGVLQAKAALAKSLFKSESVAESYQKRREAFNLATDLLASEELDRSLAKPEVEWLSQIIDAWRKQQESEDPETNNPEPDSTAAVAKGKGVDRCPEELSTVKYADVTESL